MKTIISFLFLFLAAGQMPAQKATMDSFYSSPEKVIILTGEKGKECGLLFVHVIGKEVKLFFLLIDQDIQADSKNEKKMVKFLVRTYYEEVSKRKVKIVKKLYSEADGEKYLSGLVLKKI